MARKTPDRRRATARTRGRRRAGAAARRGTRAGRAGGIGLLRDLQDLHLLATLVQSTWTVLLQGALGLRDHELIEVARGASAETARQLSWLTTHMKVIAPQTLIVEQ